MKQHKKPDLIFSISIDSLLPGSPGQWPILQRGTFRPCIFTQLGISRHICKQDYIFIMYSKIIKNKLLDPKNQDLLLQILQAKQEWQNIIQSYFLRQMLQANRNTIIQILREIDLFKCHSFPESESKRYFPGSIDFVT